MSDFIPEEVLIQILKRVPPKPLLRFRCVSKSWNSLISSPDFVCLHTRWTSLSNAASTTSAPKILVRHYSRRRKVEIYSVRHNDDVFVVDDDVKIVFPFRHFAVNGFFRIVGSCNGLVCLSDESIGYKDQLMLWNPSIRRKITLPLPRATVETIGPFYSVLGFGYDMGRNDFKVVRLAYVHGNYEGYLLPPIIEVFSLSTGNWREIKDNPVQNWVIAYPQTHAFVDGKVHWIASRESPGTGRCLIQVFDIVDEVFEEMHLPVGLVGEEPMCMAIAAYKESIAVVLKVHDWDAQFFIWVMEEYGIGKSWTKMFNILIEGRSGRVLGFRKNGDILLTIRGGKLVSYDPRTRGIMELGVIGISDDAFGDLYAGTYTESLALVNGGEQALAGLSNREEPLLTCGGQELASLPNPSGSDSSDEGSEEE